MTTAQKQRPTHLTEAVKANPKSTLTTTQDPVDTPMTDWSHTIERLAQLPSQASEWVMQYRSQLTVVAALVATVILLKLALALLEAINGIPLMQPMLELIGLGYVGGFAVQHLLTANRRQELGQTIQHWKAQVLGR
jgi:hypothetical protein